MIEKNFLFEGGYLLKAFVTSFLFAALTCTQPIPALGSRIWLAPAPLKTDQASWYPRAIEEFNGDVDQYDDQIIVIADELTKKQYRFPSSRVIWIEPHDQTLLEKQFRQSFQDRDDAAVLAGLSPVLMERPPVWRQQWLTMVAAVSASRTLRGQISLELIAQLDQRPLPLMTLAWLPISWTNRLTPQPLVKEALNRLTDQSELVQLTASSWLLASPHRDLGTSKLNELKTSSRQEVASLAKILLWRITTPEEVMSSIQKWKQIIANLPMVLSPGPIVLLKDKVKSAGDLKTAKHLQWSIEVAPMLKQLDWLDDR